PIVTEERADIGPGIPGKDRRDQRGSVVYLDVDRAVETGSVRSPSGDGVAPRVVHVSDIIGLDAVLVHREGLTCDCHRTRAGGSGGRRACVVDSSTAESGEGVYRNPLSVACGLPWTLAIEYVDEVRPCSGNGKVH